MNVINRLKQFAAAGIALTSFTDAAPKDVDIPAPSVQTYTTMDARTAAIELYRHIKEAEAKTKLSETDRATLVQDFVAEHHLSDKTVYDMTVNYAQYVSDHIKNTEKKKVNGNQLNKDKAALYSAFTQTDFYKTERDKIIKRWMPMAEQISEGYYAHGYKCTAGYPTIGIGTCLTTSGLSLNDIPIRHIQKDKNGRLLYANNQPVPGEELTLAEKQRFIRSLSQLKSSSYEAGRKVTHNAGVYGLTLSDARRVASLEAQKKMDDILKFSFLSKGVDMFKEPSAVGVLALDIHYQCGSLTNPKEWPNFWNCICNKGYSSLQEHITVNGGKNKNRHAMKVALSQHAAADYQAEHAPTSRARNKASLDRYLAYTEMSGYVDAPLGLKLTQKKTPLRHMTEGIGLAKALSAAEVAKSLKKRKITAEKKAEFEKLKKEIREAEAKKTPSAQQAAPSTGNAPYIRISSETLKRLQLQTKKLPKEKRVKPLSPQNLTRLAKRHNVNPKNLIHLTTKGGVDINVCLDYLKQETQKLNAALMRRNRNQGR